MHRRFHIYIMSNRKRGTLYVGVTSDLIKRVWEHRIGVVRGFTCKYRLRRLVYFEIWDEALPAFEREKRLKRWRRAWKLSLIESMNPEWKDLYPDLAEWAD